MAEKLAINGGDKLIPDGFIKSWPPVDRIDEDFVLSSLRQTNHAFGPNCKEFEKEFADWNGNKFAITTNSGTAALHMAVAACDCGAGDEVIVPAYSWSSSATCVLHHNCIPVFVDIDFDTMNIDTKKIEEKISEKTKAIIVVHLHGLPVNMDDILLISKKYNLKLIEDCCQAHGARFKGKKVGLWGDCAAFSFNQNKCLCSGEGGMFVTDDEKIYKKALTLWSFGETRTPVEKRDYHAYALGWMYRNNDLTAAFGRAQLRKLDDYLDVQRENADALTSELNGTKGLILPFEPENCQHNWYNYTIRLVPEELGWKKSPHIFRNAVMKAIQAEGAKVSVWQSFILPGMTVFQAKNAYGKGCPWLCKHSRQVLYDPDEYPVAQKHTDTHFGMTEPLRAPNQKDVAIMVGKAIKKVLDNIDSLDIEKLGSS
ncbi:MAG: DegT/DnrJ/EryC1/StrS family aminotransferase [Candidatus Omnitrophica bacterium]|nr:DegT/DnrJ/EryC1/StrS family aminotransferase [Candidatus Omnitrophota bacterium]MCM8821417.1 DegT/DnrJ/EryC1/StrS family aminotransferase [Candidatus Omnitrophota bacterium]MCM8827885.1 DegT/DnrJ/EryC1/StrS family aminotransferase [Candidatus Omnitrophota bacterium]